MHGVLLWHASALSAYVWCAWGYGALLICAGGASKSCHKQFNSFAVCSLVCGLQVNLKTPCTCTNVLGPHYTHNSSLLRRVPAQLRRTGGLLGSSSADQAQQQKPQQQEGSGSPSQQHRKEQRLSLGDVGGSSSNSSRSAPGQVQPPQHVSQPLPAGSAALMVQPSVCPSAAGGDAARRRQLAVAAHMADIQVAAPPVSDLVMSSPFAGMLSSAPSGRALAAAAPAGPGECSPHSGDAFGAASGSAPASTATTPKSSDDPVWSSSSDEVTATPPARQVGSAPPNMLDTMGGRGVGSVGQFGGALSAGLVLGGNGRTCALLNSASLNSLGSTELPVVVG
jgi:hypothetical protein